MSTIKSSAENLTLNADGANNDIKFQSNGVEKASIDQDGVITAGGASLDGAVVINESGADVNFRVESDTDANALSVDGGTGAVGIGTSTVANGASWGAILQLADSESCAISLHDTGGKQFDIGTSADSLYLGYDASSGAHRLSLTDSQVKIHTGDLIFGTAGKGVVLGATSNTDANTLDDYEEGTFTPNVGGDATYTNQNGSYTKVGRLVTVKINFQVNAINSSGKNIIYGLPFTSTSGAAHVGAVGYYSGLSVSPTWIGCYGDANNTTVTFIWNTGNSSQSGNNGQNLFQNSARIDISLTYQTT